MQQFSKYMMLQIIRLAWPVVLEMSGMMAVGVAVTAMVGHYGAVSVAAVGLAILVQNAVTMIFAAAGTGTAVIVARETGAGHWEQVRRVTGQAVLLGLAAGIVVAAAGYLATERIFGLIPADPAVSRLAQELLKIMFAFIPPNLILAISNAILRGMGQTRTAFLISTLSNSVALVGSYALIFDKEALKLGAAGAVWGVGAAQLIGGIVALIVLTVHPKIQLRLTEICNYQPAIVQRILDISIPAAIEQLALQGGRIVFTFLLTGVGAVQFAAHQIALQIESISFLPGFAFSVAAMILVGQSLGKDVPHRAVQYVRITRNIAFWSMAAMGAIFVVFAKPLTILFINDPDTVYWGAMCVMIAALEQPTIGLTYVFGGALRGAGDTKSPMYIAVAGVWLMRLPLIYLFITLWRYDITIAWYITAGDYLIRSVVLWRRFASRKWQAAAVLQK